ncbi:MAG TPA: hypothetical protein VFU21_08985, partial [Kofleriaceae bacterium]|nr:hypothetical protein [Kofleriaceae bacterium]
MRAGHVLVATALLVGLAAGPALAVDRARAVRKSAAAGKKTAPAPAAKKTKDTAAIGETRRLTRDQRFAAARQGARKAMKPFAGGGLDVEAVLEREQIQLTPGASSFLGRGPVRVLVRPKVTSKATRWERWTKAFRPAHNRRVLMSVSETGIPSVMEDVPDAIQHRIWRRLNGIVPFAEITRDIVGSDKAKAGLVGAVGGLFTASINPAVAVGVGLVALRYINKGVQERRATRKAALDTTAEFIREKEAAGETPAVSVAYRFYEGEMEESGSRPISKEAFVEQMSYRLGKPVKAGSDVPPQPA